MPAPLDGNGSGLPHRGVRVKRVILAQHLVLTGYGHWLPNDPRGSGSEEIRQRPIEELGDIHHGRKRVQPPRDELRSFYRRAEPLLNHDVVWFSPAMRQATADAIRQTVADRGYTLWALAVLRNHVHALVRAHRDHYTVIWHHFTQASREAILRSGENVAADHPVWSNRPYAVFLHTPNEIRGRIDYIKGNPAKEGLAPQDWPFVVPFPVGK